MARALTAKAVEKAQPGDKRVEIPDGIVAGLYLVVQPSGAKSWALRYRQAGKPVKLTLGRWPIMSLQAARIAAGEAIDKAERGENPAAEKKATKAALMQAQIEGRDKVATLFDQFDKRHLANLKSRESVLWYINRFIREPWGDRDIHSITKRDVLDLLDGIADSGRGITANRVLAHLRKFLNWCVERDIVEMNPATGVKPPVPETPRDRILSDDEIRLFCRACDDKGQPFGQLGKLLLLTGQRLGEVRQMTEGELAGDTWHLSAERTKNGRAHDVPLSKAAKAVLAGVERIKSRHGYIFTTTGDTPVSGLSRAHSSISAKMVELASEATGEPVEIERWTWHDLRRTCETGMARLGVPQEIIDRVTNHISGQHRMVRIYNQHSYAEEKREAMELWGEAVADILAGLDPVAEAKRRDIERRLQETEMAAAGNVVRLKV